MQPTAVFFDLDDTLFDHRESARAALREVHRIHAASFDFADFERHHSHYLEEMHLEVLAGRIDLDDARRERFRRVFAALGEALAPATVADVALAYRNGYMTARRALEGAAELLAELKPRVRIAIVTNNLLDEQQDKLAYCGLASFVDVLIASADVGVSKPDPRIFEIALERVGTDARSVVMIGDSWASDIVGAHAAGIRAIWFNPDRRPRPSSLPGIEELHALVPAADVAALVLTDKTPRR